MFGNMKGWIISAGLFVFVFGIFFATGLLTVPPESAPSGRLGEILKPVALPVDPKTFAPSMDGDCDAGDLYRQAAAEYWANETKYVGKNAYMQKLNTVVTDKPKATELILQATNCSKGDLYKSSPDEVVRYQGGGGLKDIEALESLGTIIRGAGMVQALAKDNAGARRYFDALFAMGYRLYQERLSWEEFNAGMNMMFDAAKQTAKIDPARAAELEAFASGLDEYKNKKCVPIWKAVRSIDRNMIGQYGGDFLAAARGAKDPLWRAEAIMAVGRMKFMTPSLGDQIAAKRVLPKILAEPGLPPSVHSAATQADALTLQGYRVLGGSN